MLHCEARVKLCTHGCSRLFKEDSGVVTKGVALAIARGH